MGNCVAQGRQEAYDTPGDRQLSALPAQISSWGKQIHTASMAWQCLLKASHLDSHLHGAGA